MHRSPTAEEVDVLRAVSSGNSAFILIPVKYRGDFRYALAVKSTSTVGVEYQVLAICVDGELDNGFFSEIESNSLELN